MERYVENVPQPIFEFVYFIHKAFWHSLHTCVELLHYTLKCNNLEFHQRFPVSFKDFPLT